jgi:lysozyme
MSAVDLAVAREQIAEGFRSSAYTDTTGHQTIGYGFNISAGISKRAALALLQAQTQEVADQLATTLQGLDMVRASVLIELGFNLGVAGLLSFHLMLQAVAAGDWTTACDQLLDSQAARQLPERYNTLAQMLLTGDTP